MLDHASIKSRCSLNDPVADGRDNCLNEPMLVLRDLAHPDGLLRVAIVRRDDGLVRLFEQRRWPEEPTWQWPSRIF